MTDAIPQPKTNGVHPAGDKRGRLWPSDATWWDSDDYTPRDKDCAPCKEPRPAKADPKFCGFCGGRLVETVGSAPIERRFSDLSAALANVSAQRRWVFEGAIEGSPIVTWIGPEKGSKSMVAIQLAVATATGGRWLGAFECMRPGPVIYLDPEYGPDEFARRLARISRGMGRAPADVLPHVHHFYSRDLFLKSSDQSAAWILDQAKQIRPTLIVVDPWRNHLAGEENSAEDTKEALHIVAQIRDACGAVMWLPHHVNKIGTYSGSRALLGRVDLIFEGSDEETPWYSARGRTVRRCDPISRRFAVTVLHDDDHDDTIARTRLALRFEGDPVSKQALSKIALRVLEHLQRAGRSLNKHGFRVLRLSGTQITHALHELRDAGLIDERAGEWSLAAASFFESTFAQAEKARDEGRAPAMVAEPETFIMPNDHRRRGRR